MLEVKVNSYSPGAFTIELNDMCYPIAHDLSLQDECVQSALLHEYIHYLQDTVTFYGVKYRSECYSNSIDKQIAGGNDSSSLGFPYMGGCFDINEEGRLMFDGEIVGATAIKENMARQAELYVFGALPGATYNAMTYQAITMFVRCSSDALSKNNLAMFVIDDCCLGTTDPSKAIVTLMQHIDIKTVESNLLQDDQALVSWLYSAIHDVFLANNIMVDQAVDTSQFDAVEWKTAAHTLIAKQIYVTQAICQSNIDDAYSLIDKIEKAYSANATLRQTNHSALSVSLMEFKKCRDFEQLFAKYGTPLIKRTGTCDPKYSNIDIILQ